MTTGEPVGGRRRLRPQAGRRGLHGVPAVPYGIPSRAHSVLTADLVDRPGHPTRAALDQVIEFYRERLGVTV